MSEDEVTRENIVLQVTRPFDYDHPANWDWDTLCDLPPGSVHVLRWDDNPVPVKGAEHGRV